MSTRHRHRWQRLSDTALFCGCGQTKEVGVPAYPIHLCSGSHYPCMLPHYPSYQAYPWNPPYVVFGSTTSPDLGTVTVWNG